MKLIIAYIKPERLNAVKQELYAREIFKISVTNALGCGQQKGYVSTYRGSEVEVNLPEQTITNKATGKIEHFEINAYKKHCLMNGLDDIDFLVENKDKIEAWENKNEA